MTDARADRLQRLLMTRAARVSLSRDFHTHTHTTMTWHSDVTSCGRYEKVTLTLSWHAASIYGIRTNTTNYIVVMAAFFWMARPGRTRSGRSFRLRPAKKNGQAGFDRVMASQKERSQYPLMQTRFNLSMQGNARGLTCKTTKTTPDISIFSARL